MSIVRIAKRDKAYSVIGNHILRNKELSFRARGVLSWLLSHAEDWQVSSETIAEEGREGRDAVRAAMTELREAGHLVYRRERASGGRISTVIDVYEAPQKVTDPQVTGDGFSGPGETTTEDGNPGPGSTAKPQVTPATGKPEPGQPPLGNPGPIRSTRSKTRDLSLRSRSLAAPAAELTRSEIQAMITREPDQIRAVMTRDGWLESSDAAWLFTRNGQRRDWLFEAVGEVVGLSTRDLTKNGRGRVNGALKQLRDVGADPLEVLRRGHRFVKQPHRGGRRPSIFELATLWAELGDAADDRFAGGDARHADAVARAARVVSG